MSVETLWQSEARRIWEDLKDLRGCFNKLDTDMYRGEGPLNPSITHRLSSVEGQVDRIEGRQKESRWILQAIFVAVVADILKDIGMPVLHAIFK